MSVCQNLEELKNKFVESQETLDNEFEKVYWENKWELYQ